MKRRIAMLVLLLVSGASSAAESCEPDVGGTFKTGQAELMKVTHVTCVGCREINHHAADIRNFMWNWAVLGRASTLSANHRGLGRYIFGFRLDQELIVTPIFGDQSGSNVMSVPVCNDHGQCATGTVDIEHNLIGIRTSHGFTMGINVGIKKIHISNTLPSGRVTSVTYLAEQMKAHRNMANFKLPVPADKNADHAKQGDCLNNVGEKRPPESQMTPTNGSNRPDMEESYDRWWDEEEAYGGRVPTHRCGISSISGGGSTRTCGWFWF